MKVSAQFILNFKNATITAVRLLKILRNNSIASNMLFLKKLVSKPFGKRIHFSLTVVCLINFKRAFVCGSSLSTLCKCYTEGCTGRADPTHPYY